MTLQEQFSNLKKHAHSQVFLDFKTRKLLLKKLKTILKKNAILLATATNKDFLFKSIQETMLLEIIPALNTINYCLKNIKKWMKVRNRRVDLLFKPAKAYLFPQPKGIVGIMVPWNYPILLTISPLTYALAAGNRVIIKHSELTPHTSGLLKELFAQHIESNILTVVQGHKQLSKEFANLPFDHLFFTGSVSVGKEIMAAASKNLTPLTLELGGKSPAIISKTINWKNFKRLCLGKIANAGQTCVAPDYLLIPKDFEKHIEKEFAKFFKLHYPNLINNQDYSGIISKHHHKRLTNLLEDARRKGARIITYGKTSGKTSKAIKIPFYLVFAVTQDMHIMQEEIFGPILPIITYTNFIETLAVINEYPHALALYYFGEDSLEKNLLLKHTISGALSINDVLTHVGIDDLPFGGIGQSGFGKYHGQEGFDNFSQLKPVFIQKRYTLITWLYPPYGKLLIIILKILYGIKFKLNWFKLYKN